MASSKHEHIKLPLPSREIYDEALRFTESSKKTMSDHIAQLSFEQQKILEQTLRDIDSQIYSQPPTGSAASSVVVALHRHFRTQRSSRLHRLRGLFSRNNTELRSDWVRITLMRLFSTEKIEDTETTVENDGGNKDQVQEGITDMSTDEMEANTSGGDHPDEAATAAGTTKEVPPFEEQKAPVTLVDAVARKFSFPFGLCRTWEVSLLHHFLTIQAKPRREPSS